jgi:hypothetical protein
MKFLRAVGMMKSILIGSIAILTTFPAYAADRFRLVFETGPGEAVDPGLPGFVVRVGRVGAAGSFVAPVPGLNKLDNAELTATKVANAINAKKPGAARAEGSFVYVDTELNRVEVTGNKSGIKGSIQDVNNGTSTGSLKRGAKIILSKPAGNAGAALIDPLYSPISIGFGIDSGNYSATYSFIQGDTQDDVFGFLLADLGLAISCSSDECLSSQYEFSSMAEVQFQNNYFFGAGIESVDVPAPIPVLGIYSSLTFARRLRHRTKSLRDKPHLGT